MAPPAKSCIQRCCNKGCLDEPSFLQPWQPKLTLTCCARPSHQMDEFMCNASQYQISSDRAFAALHPRHPPHWFHAFHAATLIDSQYMTITHADPSPAVKLPYAVRQSVGQPAPSSVGAMGSAPCSEGAAAFTELHAPSPRVHAAGAWGLALAATLQHAVAHGPCSSQEASMPHTPLLLLLLLPRVLNSP